MPAPAMVRSRRSTSRTRPTSRSTTSPRSCRRSSPDRFDQLARRARPPRATTRSTRPPCARSSQARAALPAGVYRWGSFELAVDTQHRLGWRRTTDAGLGETAAYDGTTLDAPLRRARSRRHARGRHRRRRTRDRLPAGVDRRAGALREVLRRQVARRARGHALDARERAAVRAQRSTIRRTSSRSATPRAPSCPTSRGPPVRRARRARSARTSPSASPAQPIADAPRGRIARRRAGRRVDLPLLCRIWQTTVAKGSRHAWRWRTHSASCIAAAAAVGDRTTELYRRTRRCARTAASSSATSCSRAAASRPPDDRCAVRPRRSRRSRTSRSRATCAASRAYGKSPTPDAARAVVADGLVGTCGRCASRPPSSRPDHGKAAVDRLAAIDRARGCACTARRRCPALRRQARGPHAGVGAARHQSALKNIARAQAAYALAPARPDRRGAERDHEARRRARPRTRRRRSCAVPARHLQQSRRGSAGWQIVCAKWRDRVLAGGSFAHVLLDRPGRARRRPTICSACSARAAELAAGDPVRNARRRAARVPLPPGRPRADAARAAAEGVADRARSTSSPRSSRSRRAAPPTRSRISRQAQDAGGDEAVTSAPCAPSCADHLASRRELALAVAGPGAPGRRRARRCTGVTAGARSIRATRRSIASSATCCSPSATPQARGASCRRRSSAIRGRARATSNVADAFEHQGKVDRGARRSGSRRS